MNELEHFCACGHERTLHDPHGRAAFLGGFASTAHMKRYCDCKRPRESYVSIVHNLPLYRPVAEVRVRERPGAAIGVCEFPPALELGASAEDVLTALKQRLRDAISPPSDGSRQMLRIVYERPRERRVRVEALR